MFNDITSIKFSSTNSNSDNSLAQAKKNESVTIFENNNVENDEQLVKLSRREIRKEERRKKAEIANVPDKIIQGGKQGYDAGDCWLLSQMNSIAKTEWGKDAFKDLIKHDKEKGTYTLYFKGIDKTFVFTQKEFDKAKNRSDLSSGDADALLIEMAVEKYFIEADLNEKTIKGNEVVGEDSLYYMMTGREGVKTRNPNVYEYILKEMGKNPETNSQFAATYIYKDFSSNDVHSQHALSIHHVELNEQGEIESVVVIDPYYPNKPIKKSFNSFKQNLLMFGYINGQSFANNNNTQNATSSQNN